MAKKLKVVLLGYMASGKSSIGKLLAEQLKLPFKDLDLEIEKSVGIDIPTIFNKKGELFFRKKETEVLKELMNSDEAFVLALGGGTPCYGSNLQIIDSQTEHTIYLRLKIPTLVNRIMNEKNQRPLVATISDGELPEFIGKHLFERSPFYSKADIIIECDDKSIQAIVKEVVEKLV